MRYSVIIPVFNRRQKLARAINSVFGLQKAADDFIEIVVVDDASTDASAEVARSAGVDRLIILEKNIGVTGARNRGIEDSSGDFLILLDSDDELTFDALLKIRQHFEANPATHILFGACIDRTGAVMHREKARLGEVTYRHFLANSAPGEFLPVVRREVFQKILFLERLRGFEGITWLQAARNGYILHYSSAVLRIYDKDGEDRLCRRQNILKGSARLARGWHYFMSEFGTDLWSLNKKAYLKILFRWAVYSRIQTEISGQLWTSLADGNPRRQTLHSCVVVLCNVLPRAFWVRYLNSR